MLYLDIFRRDYVDRTPFGGIVHNRDIDYIRRLYTFNKDAIEAYYQERNFSVKNTHLISRLIEHFPTYLSTDVYSYLESVERTLTYLGKHFKLTSDVERGVLHPPYFFGNEGDEVIFAGYERFDAIEGARQWKTLTCLKVLKHPRNDAKLLLPLGRDDGSRGGLSAVYIDLAKLAIKYREFLRANAAGLDTGIVLSKNNFVLKHVLSTSVSGLVDHMLINKVMDRFYGRQTITPNKKHPFKLFEPTVQLERYTEQVLDIITGKPMDFIQMLRHIECVFERNAADAMCLPEFYGSRQMMPAIIGSRIDVMVFLLDTAKSLDMNRKYLNDWQLLAKRLLNESALGSFYTYEIERDIRAKLDRLTQL